jgi:hypothetical protein
MADRELHERGELTEDRFEQIKQWFMAAEPEDTDFLARVTFDYVSVLIAARGYERVLRARASRN